MTELIFHRLLYDNNNNKSNNKRITTTTTTKEKKKTPKKHTPLRRTNIGDANNWKQGNNAISTSNIKHYMTCLLNVFRLKNLQYMAISISCIAYRKMEVVELERVGTTRDRVCHRDIKK